MSRPANPLSKFRSYSYYHVLVLCDSSQTAEALSRAENQRPERWLHPTAPNPALGKHDTYGTLGPFAVKFVDEKQKCGRYCVLINGATDAAFTITTARWFSATGANATMLDQSTSLAMEGTLEISEPKGVVFMDILVTCCLALGIDAANAVYALKTFFVGHQDGIEDRLLANESYLTDVEPLRFLAWDITGSFSETGGQYQIAFAALNHGASRLPQFGKAANGFNFTAGTTLESTMKVLQDQINSNYDKLFNCVRDTVKKAEAGTVFQSVLTGEGTRKPYSELLDRVTYEIDLSDDYTGKNAGNYTVNDQPVQSKNRARCTQPVNVNIPANMSIEDAIHQIMKRCPQVIKEMGQDGSTDAEDGSSGPAIRYEYKIHTGVQSWCDEGDGNKIKYKVRYHIQRFMRPKDVSLFDSFKVGANAADVDFTQLEPAQVAKLSTPERFLYNNLISFDYIYTGKNIDILEFDMKMNLGLAYLQIATINNTMKDQLQAVPTATTHLPQYDAAKIDRMGQPTQIPVFFGSQVRLPSVRNKNNSTANVDASYSLSKHASLEVLDATMRIHGNPYLLSTINRASSPEKIGTSPTEQNVNPTTRLANFLDWGGFPSFAKVNIKMPRNNDDIGLFKTTPSNANLDPNKDVDRIGAADFTRDFWFTGFYYVYGIEHSFEGGEFTQTFSMIGIPQTRATQAVTKQGQNRTEFKVQTDILSCYGNYVPICGQNQPANNSGSQESTPTPAGKSPNPSQIEKVKKLPVAPPAAPTDSSTANLQKAATPTNFADAKIAAGGIDPNKVEGWNKASPEVRQAVSDASKKHGVDEGFMVAMAAKESRFNPNAVNPATDARGLYQFIPSTWDGTRPGYGVKNQFGKQLGLEGKTNAQVDAARTDPRTNAEAAALLAQQNKDYIERRVGGGYQATASDLYLAHFQGPNDASKLIKASQTDPNQSVESVLGTDRYNTVVNANPSYAKYKTVGAWRANNARGLTSSTLGTSVVQSKTQTSTSPQRQTSGSRGVQPDASRQTANAGTTSTTGVDKIKENKQCPTKPAGQQKQDNNSCTQNPVNSKDGKNK